MKRIDKKNKSLQKRKKRKTTSKKQIDDAKDVLKEQGNFWSDWRVLDLTKMIRYKQPKTMLSSRPRSQLEKVSNIVKDLPALELDDIPRWNEKDESNLIEFRKDGRHNLTRCYVMKRAKRWKMKEKEKWLLYFQETKSKL